MRSGCYDLDHGWGPQHAAWNGGAMDNWIPAHRQADGAAGPLTMGYLTRADLPFYYALADAFTICDGYHCSVFGPTYPNRYYLMTATHRSGRASMAARRSTMTAAPIRLGDLSRAAGTGGHLLARLSRPGRLRLQCPANISPSTSRRRETSPLYQNAMRDRPFYELLWDLQTGNIPQVSWIVPPSHLSEHPDYLPAAGEDHTAQILHALWSNPKLWAKTALILNYDENDGLFDHVVPPTPPPGTPGEFVDGLPIGLGYRVPCLVISPFSRGGYVCGATFDHTSTLRLLEARFGVEVPNLSQWRRADLRRSDHRVRLRRGAALRCSASAGDGARSAHGGGTRDGFAAARRSGAPGSAAPGARLAPAPRLMHPWRCLLSGRKFALILAVPVSSLYAWPATLQISDRQA